MAQVAAYARFSSENQNDLSIDAQMSAIKEAAKKNGDEVVAVYEDRAESGTTADRDQFMEMFNAVQDGKLKISKVLVYSFSRFMRNAEESRFFKMRMKAMGVDVISATQPLPGEESMAKAVEGMIEIFDKLTSDVIGKHVRSGMEELARRGYWTGGPPPFGYSIKEIDSREGHTLNGEIIKRATLVPNEAEAAIVRRIFEISSTADVGGHRIYATLCEELGREILGRNGKKLGGRGVNAVLRKAIYKGLFVYGSHGYELIYDENPDNKRRMRKTRVHKADKAVVNQIEDWRLVSDELWEAAQRNRAKNIREDFGHGPKRAAYLLTGLIRCGTCGNSVGGHWQQNGDGSNKYHYYRCRGAMNGSGICPNSAKVRGVELEAAVIAMIEEQLLSESFLESLLDEIIRLKEQEAATTDRAALERRRDELTRQIANLTQVAMLASDVAEVGQQLAALNRERTAIEAKLAPERNDVAAVDRATWRAGLAMRLGGTLGLLKTPADIDQLRLELGRWIEEIRLNADGRIWLRWKTKSVFELLNLSPMSEMGEGG